MAERPWLFCIEGLILHEETIYMKKFFYGMIALLGASLCFLGCEMEVEVPVPYPVSGPPTAITYDVVARSFSALSAYLQDPNISVIGLEGNIKTMEKFEIPSGKTLYILAGSLDLTYYATLTISGAVYVGYGTALLNTGSASIVVDQGGNITVLYGGTFLIDTVSAVVVRSYSSTTALGTDAVTIDGGMLGIEKIQHMTEIAKVFPSVKKGRLVAESIVKASSIMPSDISKDVSKIEGISKDRMLLVFLDGGKAEEDTELSIPEGLVLVTNTSIASVETLTVDGVLDLYSDITISDSQTKTLEVTGELIMEPDTTLTVEKAVEKAVEIAAPGILTLGYGSKLKTTAGGTVKFGKTTFSGAGEWTAVAFGEEADAVRTSVSIVSYEEGALVAFNPSGASTAGFLVAFEKPVITQGTGLNNELVIWQNTIIHLQGTTDDPVGQIVLESGANPGCLTLYHTSSKVLAGAGTGGTKVPTLYDLTIGGQAVRMNYRSSMDFLKDSGNKLLQLGTTTNLKITASTTAGEDVEIDSTAVIARKN
jgi:hypothetical protein